VRPAAERRQFNGNWPAAIEPLSDTYVDQVFQGPLGLAEKAFFGVSFDDNL
jgi:hypothetical protein